MRTRAAAPIWNKVLAAGSGLLLGSLAGIFPARSQPLSTAFYVSPEGSDSAPGTLNAPFLSVQRARDAASTAIRAGTTGDVVIYLRGGVHQLKSPLLLGPRSSGVAGHKVIYRSYPGEQAIISGGKPVRGWALYDRSRNIYRSFVGTGWEFRQLYVNGRHVQRARGPQNPGGFRRTATGFITTDTSMARWNNITDVEVVFLGKWMMNRCKIVSIKDDAITMANPCWRNSHWALRWGANLPSWIENAYELLDSPGEWYLDRHSGYVYYMPRPGESMATAEVVAPYLEDMISGASAHDIEFKDLTFTYSNWTGPDSPNGYVGLQAGYHKTGVADLVRMHSPIHFASSRDIEFQDNLFTHLGSRSLTFEQGSRDIRIIGNRFVETAAGAIQFGQIDDHATTDPTRQNRSMTIHNNLIRDVCFDYMDDDAIVGVYVAQMTVDHNEIADIPSIGVSIGWGWGKVASYARSNRITWNYIHQFSRIFHDSAAIYTLGAQPDTIVQYNHVQDGGQGYGCLYPDEGSAYQTWTANVCRNVSQWLHVWESSIHDIVVTGNWSDTMSMENKGSHNSIFNNQIVADGRWPPGAQEVVEHAGLE